MYYERGKTHQNRLGGEREKKQTVRIRRGRMNIHVLAEYVRAYDELFPRRGVIFMKNESALFVRRLALHRITSTAGCSNNRSVHTNLRSCRLSLERIHPRIYERGTQKTQN